MLGRVRARRSPRFSTRRKRLLLELLETRRVLATFVVDAQFDSSGFCAPDDPAANSDCTLRAAIQAAESNPGPDRIEIPQGTYLLDAIFGSLTVTADDDIDLVGLGANASQVVIDANQSMRVFDLDASGNLPGVTVSFANLTIQNGNVSDAGGGINSSIGLNVTLDEVVVQNNVAELGGGIAMHGGVSGPGRLTIGDSVIQNNSATTDGGGIYFDDGAELSVSATDFVGNSADGDGGGVSIGDDADAATFASVSFQNNSASDSGGGMLASGGAISIVDSSFSGNDAAGAAGADGNGGGLFVGNDTGNTSLATSDTTFLQNTSRGGGGGVFLLNTDATLDGVTARNNAVTGNGLTFESGGGGIVIVGETRIPSVTIQNSVFDSNSAPAAGGVAVVDGNVTLTDVTISDNTTTESQSGGGGIGATGSVAQTTTLQVQRAQIAGNLSAGEAGGIGVIDVDLTVTDTTISGNTAQLGRGGGIGVLGNQQTPTATILRSTINNNTATGVGGGVAVEEAGLDLQNVTVSGNSSSSDGGGIAYSNSQATVARSIRYATIADNSAADNGDNLVAQGVPLLVEGSIFAGGDCQTAQGSVISQGHNIDSGSSCGFFEPTDLFFVDPLLGSLQDNGGPVPTRALLLGSPAIDAGGSNAPQIDARGFPRPLDGDGDRVAASDVGAFEADQVNPLHLLTTGSGDGTVSVNVDGFGAFGSDVFPTFNFGEAAYDPVGPLPASGTTFASGVAFRLGNSGPRQFLTTGAIDGSGRLENPLISGDTGSASSSFTIGNLTFNLTQAVTPQFNASGQPIGSELVQTYAITNTGPAVADFELIRYIDGDLEFDGSIEDGGGRFVTPSGREFLFETDAGGSGVTDTTFLGITAVDGVTPQQGRFEVDEFSGLANRILAGTALDDTIAGDGDGDGFVDVGQEYDVTLALRNLFNLPVGESATYTTRTLFGSGAPADVEQGPGDIEGHVYCDANGNGMEDSNEAVANTTVFVDRDGDRRLDSNEPVTSTNSLGDFQFSGIGPGDHVVVAEVPSNCNTIPTQPGVARAVANVGALPRGITAADVNGDDLLDLLVASDLGNSLTVLENTGDGFISEPSTELLGRPQAVAAWQPAGSSQPPTIAVAAVGTPSDGGVVYRIGTAEPDRLEMGNGPIDVAVDDFNNDNLADVVSASFRSATLSLRLGGSDESIVLGSVRNLRTVATGDVNGDGFRDIIYAGAGFPPDGRSQLQVLFGDGTGGFPTSATVEPDTGVISVLAADLDLDGSDEVLTLVTPGRRVNSRGEAIELPGKLLAFELASGGQNPQLQTYSSQSVSAGATAFGVGNFNDDELPDVAIANIDQQAVQLLVGKQSGGFRLVSSIGNVPAPSDLVVFDADNDGIDDIAVANLYSVSSRATEQQPAEYSLPSTVTILRLNVAESSVVVTSNVQATADFELPSADPDLGAGVPAQVTGVKWQDDDGDGIRDPNEPGLADVLVYIDLDNDDQFDSTEPNARTTDDGSYLLQFPAAGTFTVREDADPGFLQTFPQGGEHVVVFDGETPPEGLNFGNRPARDFGDAPSPFPTVGPNAASHGFLPGLTLGSSIDFELDGQPAADGTATGDDTNGPPLPGGGVVDDEDGIVLSQPLNIIDRSDNEIQVTATNTTGQAARLQGWIDFNNDGDWTDPTDQIIRDIVVGTGVTTIPFQVPADAVRDEPLNARFRYGFEFSIGPSGSAVAGEVEDYQFVIRTRSVAVNDLFQVAPGVANNRLNVLDNDFELASDPIVGLVPSASTAGGTVVLDNVQQSLLYTPPAGFVGTDSFSYQIITQSGDTDTATVTVFVGTPEGEFTNADDPLDVNDDGSVSALDALNVINALNRQGPGDLLAASGEDRTAATSGSRLFVDTNGDARLSPVDALVVINYLNGASRGMGEGEASLPVPVESAEGPSSYGRGSSADAVFEHLAGEDPELGLVATSTAAALLPQPIVGRVATGGDEESSAVDLLAEDLADLLS